MLIANLTAVQNRVLAAIAAGATLKAAAEAANIHRNTIAYWRSTSQPFRDSLTQAQYDKAVDLSEQAEEYVNEAFAAVLEILTSRETNASARLKAAQMIFDQASAPPPPEPRVETVHSPAQMQPRNALCACGSGVKFKRCCFNQQSDPRPKEAVLSPPINQPPTLKLLN